MTVDPYDDDLLWRFAIGAVSNAERAEIEARIEEHPELLDAVGAAEEELVLLFIRDELPVEWRSRFADALNDSPALRRRVEDTRALVDAASVPARPRWQSRPLLLLALAAGMILATAVAVWRGVGRPASAPGETAPPVAVRPEPVVLALDLTLTRDATRQRNVFAVRSDADREIRLTMPGVRDAAIRGAVTAVGGPPIAVPGQPLARVTAAGLEVTWTIPAALLPPGDYLVAIRSDADPAGPPLASGFFSIVSAPVR